MKFLPEMVCIAVFRLAVKSGGDTKHRSANGRETCTSELDAVPELSEVSRPGTCRSF